MGKRIALIVSCALFTVFSATGGQWDKLTTVTFSRPVELPGMVLPAGKYVFLLADTPTSRHVVQVFNPEQNHLYGTFLALPNLRLKPTGDTVMNFQERPANSPEALRAWFYPGDSFGQEFVYPKVEATELAVASHVMVPAAEVTPTEKPEELMEAPVVAITPEREEVEIARAVEPPPIAAPAPAPVAAAEPAPAELPKTASPIPLVALLGLSSLGLAGGFRWAAKRVS
jgi:hypothetical protein